MKNFTLQILKTAIFATSTISCGNNVDTENQKEIEKPNIVILFADDLGYGDLECYGHPTIKTPNLDNMANEGMRFTQFYVSATICTPSRGALLTGRLPVRTGIHSGVFFPDSKLGIPQEELTLPEALKEAGYATACFGKWHLGHHEQYLPTNNGFDEYFGIPYSNDMGHRPGSGRFSKFPPLPLIKGTKVIEEDPDQRYLTKRYTEKALDFIQRKKGESFFLYLPYTMPHTPIFASEKFKGTSRRGLYGDVVSEIDWSVGEILKTLKELDLQDKTFVFFTSDNGPWLVKKERGGSAGPLHEGKFTTWEGGMREPAIAWWPGVIPAGKTEAAMVSSLDIFPTCAALAGVQIPEEKVYDGYNMMPLLMGKAEKIRDVIWYYRGSSLYAVRKGPWKLHFQTFSNPYTSESEYENRKENPLLFNIEADPSEKYNIAGEHPDKVNELKALADKHLKKTEVEPSIIKPRIEL